LLRASSYVTFRDSIDHALLALLGISQRACIYITISNFIGWYPPASKVSLVLLALSMKNWRCWWISHRSVISSLNLRWNHTLITI